MSEAPVNFYTETMDNLTVKADVSGIMVVDINLKGVGNFSAWQRVVFDEIGKKAVSRIFGYRQ